MFIICMYQIVEIMRFCKVGEKTELIEENIMHN